MKKLLGRIYYSVKHKFKLKLAVHNWQQIKGKLETVQVEKSTALSNSPIKKVLIYPSDLNTIIGALGDDAMISASLDQLRKVHAELEVFVLCKSTSENIVKSFGYTPISLPNIDLDRHPRYFRELYDNLSIDYLVILGADIMDGYYGVMHPASALIAADLAVSYGVKPVFLGFSFNKTPNQELSSFYKRIDQRLILNIRDNISLERIRNFTKANSVLVADAAFCLVPSSIPASVKNWIEEQKSNEKLIIGFNVHPMLFKNASKEQIQKIISSAITAIEGLSKSFHVSFILLPHDYRGHHGDSVCLEPIFHALKEDSNLNVYFLEGKFRASDLKAIVGALDGVVTGRMHLAIASLGMGTPTLCITYQDKFEGLYRHFSLPNNLLLPPEMMINPDNFTSELTGFIENLTSFKKMVRSKKPDVVALSEKSFNNL